MRWWHPSPDEPELFDWWRPLMLVSRRARAEQIPWPIYVEEFALGGRVERGKRPAIWVYEHRVNGGEILVDWHGQTYEFIRYRTGPQLGRFKEIRLRGAIWRARIPEVVEPVWYDEPPRDRDTGPLDPQPWVVSPRTVRRGHLSLVPPLPSLN